MLDYVPTQNPDDYMQVPLHRLTLSDGLLQHKAFAVANFVNRDEARFLKIALAFCHVLLFWLNDAVFVLDCFTPRHLKGLEIHFWLEESAHLLSSNFGQVTVLQHDLDLCFPVIKLLLSLDRVAPEVADVVSLDDAELSLFPVSIDFGLIFLGSQTLQLHLQLLLPS